MAAVNITFSGGGSGGGGTPTGANEVIVTDGNISLVDASGVSRTIPANFAQTAAFSGNNTTLAVPIAEAATTDVYLVSGTNAEQIWYTAQAGQVTFSRNAGGASGLAFSYIRIRKI